MARWIPSSSRPGTGRSRGRVAPPASSTLSNSSTSERALTTVASARQAPGHLGGALPHRDAAAELDALGLHLGQAAVEDRLLHLELGDPVAQEPAGLLGPLEDHHLVAGPGQLLGGGQPGGPGADHGHPLAGGRRAGTGTTQSSAQARSTISYSMRSMVTGSSLMPRTQAPSHGAGHSRPVNSGKLLVACRRSAASAHSSR